MDEPWEYRDLNDDLPRPNPFDLLRKIHIGDRTLNGILAPPETVLEFPVTIRRGTVFEFGYMTLPSDMVERPNVEFSVYVVGSGTRERIFSDTLSHDDSSSARIFYEKRELSSSSVRSGKLVLVTRPLVPEVAGLNQCAWVNPHLYVPGTRPKGVILVSLDTARRDYLGVYAGDRRLTPRIDSLSEDAVVFDNAFAQSPWTLPSHASLLTGLYPSAHGASTFSSRIASHIRTLPQMLRQRGYACVAYTGDGPVSHNFGFSKGFDLFKEGDGLRTPDASGPVFRRAAEFIRANRGKNFFLLLHTFQFHGPLESPEEVIAEVLQGRRHLWRTRSLEDLGGRSKYKPLSEEEIENIRLLYEAEIRTIDRYLIGPLVKLLKDEELYDQTMLIVTSDHGEEIFDHGGWQHGHSLYNEITKVPLIIKFPRSRYAGARIRENVRLVDVAPTVLEVLGIAASDYEFDGESLIPLLDGDEDELRACFSEFAPMEERPHLPGRVSVVWGDHKLIANEVIPDWEGYFDFPPPRVSAFELYDLQVDSLEKKNIYSASDTTARALLAMVGDYRREKRERGEAMIMDDRTKAKLKALGYLR